MKSSAKTVEEYIKSLPNDRQEAISEIRDVIKRNLPGGYLNNKNTPLPYISLASQKQYISIYLMAIYGDKKADKWFREEYEKSHKKS